MAERSDTDDTITSPPKVNKKEKEITVVQDSGFFRHSTGDVYDGFFEAKKKDKSVKMHGPGTYTTHDGDIYNGVWEGDKFGYGCEEAVISYHTGAKYEGFVKDWSYNGKGKYTYPDGSFMSCNFENNCPVGHLQFTDPNGHVWVAKADTGFAWFEPVNHYYSILDNVLDKSEIRRRRKELSQKGPPKSKMVMADTLPTADVKKKVRISNVTKTINK